MTATAWYVDQQETTRPAADRHGEYYTLGELDAILALHDEGAKVTDIALAAGRTYAAISTVLNDIDHARTVRNTLARRARTEAPCPTCWLIHPGDC